MTCDQNWRCKCRRPGMGLPLNKFDVHKGHQPPSFNG